MSLTIGLIAIKGQYTDRLSEVFNFFELVDAKNDKILNSWEEVFEIMDDEYMNQNDDFQRRIVWIDNAWTIIEDLSLILCTNDEALIKISSHYSTPVFSLATQGTSGSYGFWYFDKEKIRSFFNSNGDVTDNFGTSLTEETNFQINENAFYDDIQGVAKQFGIDWENAQNINQFIVKKLININESNNEIEKTISHKRRAKPWWKFW